MKFSSPRMYNHKKVKNDRNKIFGAIIFFTGLSLILYASGIKDQRDSLSMDLQEQLLQPTIQNALRELSTPVYAATVSATPVIVEQTEKQLILNYIVEKFGDRSADAITLVNKCENHAFNPKAINHNHNGTVDRGIFQINSIHGGEEMFDWKQNIDMAYKIYHAQGNSFRAWTCAGVVGEKNYLGQ